MMRSHTWNLLVVLACACFALTASSASAEHAQCGDVITQDTKLDADLFDCPGDGLVIGAENITLRLNGHIVDGDALGGQGIDNDGGYDGVVVRGPGTVRDFGAGVTLVNASANEVRGVEASGNGVGISLSGRTAKDNLITRNALSQNLLAGIRVEDEYAGNAEAGANRIERNTIFGNRDGIVLAGNGDGNRFERNIVSNNRIGIFLSDSFGHSLISKNALAMNCIGIRLLDSQNARIERNTVRGGIGPCLLVGEGDGIHLFPDAFRNLVIRNVVEQSSDDGINIGDPSNTLTRNTANENGDLGIEAVFDEGVEAIPGVTDGGGNRARGNGNPAQCVGVSCK